MKFFSIFTNTQYTFEGKHSWENVVLLAYRHWFTLLAQGIAFFFFAILPIAVRLLAGDWIAQWGLEDLFRVLLIAYFLIWWYSFFYQVAMYLLDTWIITDHRVIDSEQHGFFNRTVAELSLTQIEDVSTRVEGFFPTLLNFGDLDVQTAGAYPKFSFKEIPNPVAVKDLLMHTRNEFITNHPGNLEIHEPHQ
ncbi:MAG TPA: PH domain-containing protein [Candidatus Paceibacterota bacterium]|nr:PH domain-containing protein [Candidatus Paceibacterota bacterium]